jgi:hypothetical protein
MHLTGKRFSADLDCVFSIRSHTICKELLRGFFLTGRMVVFKPKKESQMKRKNTGMARKVRMAVMTVTFIAGVRFVAEAQTVWVSAEDGVWSDAAAWTAGVPDANAAFLTNQTASYKVTVEEPPATHYGNLTLANAAGNTTRLDVAASGFASTNGMLSIGRGATVAVNTGGVMGYTGRTPATAPFVEIKDGGVWRVDGGTIDFTDLRRVTPTSGSCYVYVGNGSTGRMEVTSGEVLFKGVESSGETNKTVVVRVGNGTGGCGELVMSGGSMTLYNPSSEWSQRVLDIGANGIGVMGAVSLSGEALMLVSNMVYVGGQQGTGTLDVAGNAVFRMPRSNRLYVGKLSKALGIVTVRENGFLNLGGTDGLQMGTDSGRGILNIEGGRAEVCGLHLSVSGSPWAGGYGELNLTGGMLTHRTGNGYGISVARAHTATAGAYGVIRMTGGLIDHSLGLWQQDWSQNGIILGKVGNAANVGGNALGEFFISGGTVTNSGQFILGMGPGATGVVVQTGGDIRQAVVNPSPRSFLTVGWGGGCGSYTLSGGSVVSWRNTYIGGHFTNDYGYVPTDVAFTSNSVGVLRIDGGYLTVTNADLFIGRNGTGTLILGSNGVCTARHVTLTNNTQATVRFELGETGCGTLTAIDTLSLSADAKLEVDTTRYQGEPVWLKLIDCATRKGAFAEEDILVTGKGIVVQDRGDDDVWLFIERGTVIQVF